MELSKALALLRNWEMASLGGCLLSSNRRVGVVGAVCDLAMSLVAKTF